MQADIRNVFCHRLKEARLSKGLSQKKLGIMAGLDEFVASTRINRYELGVYSVEPNMAKRLAIVLDVPISYFFAEEDYLAEIILLLNKLPLSQQKIVCDFAKTLPKDNK